MKKKIFGLCCALGIGTTTLFAQQGVMASGGNASGAGGSVSYSIGQVFYVAAGTTDNIVQGMQQPYEITVTAVDESAATSAITLNATVYPTPATDLFTLRIERPDLKNLRYVLNDASGRMVAEGEIESNETVISASALAESHYFLTVLESNRSIKTFKIIKSY